MISGEIFKGALWAGTQSAVRQHSIEGVSLSRGLHRCMIGQNRFV